MLYVRMICRMPCQLTGVLLGAARMEPLPSLRITDVVLKWSSKNWSQWEKSPKQENFGQKLDLFTFQSGPLDCLSICMNLVCCSLLVSAVSGFGWSGSGKPYTTSEGPHTWWTRMKLVLEPSHTFSHQSQTSKRSQSRYWWIIMNYDDM